MQILVGAMLGGGIGTVLGGLIGLLLAAWATKHVGAIGGPSAAVFAGGALVFLATGFARSVWITLLWIVAGVGVWVTLWEAGITWFGWNLADTLLPWTLGAVVIATPGSTRGLVVRFSLQGQGLCHRFVGPILLPAYAWAIVGLTYLLVVFLGWLIAALTYLIPHRRARAAAGFGLAGAFGGALTGGIGGALIGAFSGDAGTVAFQGAYGAAIGCAILGAIGGLEGSIEATWSLHAPAPQQDD
jgi:hypothetical protein